MKIKEMKRININEVRSICIHNDWYTCGTIAEYDKMFEMCKAFKGTTKELYAIAKDIVEKSDMSRYYKSGLTNNEVIENVMCFIANDATEISYEIVETVEDRIEQAMVFLGIDDIGPSALNPYSTDCYTLGDMECIAKKADCELRDVMRYLKKNHRRIG